MSIAKSLRKANNLSGVNQGLMDIGEFIRQQKADEEQKNFQKNILDVVGKMKGYYSPQNTVTSSSITDPNKLERGNLLAGGISNDLSIPLGGTNNRPVMDQQKEGVINPLVYTPGKNETTPVNYRKANNLADEDISTLALNTLSNKFLNPEKVQQGLSVLSQLKAGYQPRQRSSFTVGEGAIHKEWNPDTQQYETTENVKDFNTKLENIVSYELDEKGSPKVYNLPNGQKAYKKLTKTPDGKQIKEDYEQLAFPPTGNNVIVNLPGEDKWKNFGQLYTQYQNPQKPTEAEIDKMRWNLQAKHNIKEDTPDWINKIPREERLQYEAYTAGENNRKVSKDMLYNTAMGNLVPSAKKWYDDNIKSKDLGWGRENISSDDYLIELRESLEKNQITPEAAEDLLEFNAFRPEIIGNLDKESYKNKPGKK